MTLDDLFFFELLIKWQLNIDINCTDPTDEGAKT